MKENQEFLTLRFVLINEGESNRKVIAGKNLRMRQKKFRAVI